MNVYGGGQGYLVETSLVGTNQKTTLLKSIRAENNGWGVKITGTYNEVRGATADLDTLGRIYVTGASNNLNSNRIQNNTGVGIDVVSGDSNPVKANKVGRTAVGRQQGGGDPGDSVRATRERERRLLERRASASASTGPEPGVQERRR